MRDDPKYLFLELYCDADYGHPTDARSTTGGWLVLRGPNTDFPLACIHHKQHATSRSTTEAEDVALAQSLFAEGVPALSLWEVLLKRKVDLHVREDNEAAIKAIRKGYSAKMRHTPRTHRVDLQSVKEALDNDSVEMSHVETAHQRADVFTKDLAPSKWTPAVEMLNLHSFSKAAAGGA